MCLISLNEVILKSIVMMTEALQTHKKSLLYEITNSAAAPLSPEEPRNKQTNNCAILEGDISACMFPQGLTRKDRT